MHGIGLLMSVLACGKLDLQALPLMCEFHTMGLLQAALYPPPWINDPCYLLALPSYSTFINRK